MDLCSINQRSFLYTIADLVCNNGLAHICATRHNMTALLPSVRRYIYIYKALWPPISGDIQYNNISICEDMRYRKTEKKGEDANN